MDSEVIIQHLDRMESVKVDIGDMVRLERGSGGLIFEEFLSQETGPVKKDLGG